MKQQLVREMVGGEWYEYIPLGKFVVAAPGVCRGRPTFKYTRIEVAGFLECLAAGHDIEALIIDSRGRLSREAIAEAATIAAKALARQATSRVAGVRRRRSREQKHDEHPDQRLYCGRWASGAFT